MHTTRHHGRLRLVAIAALTLLIPLAFGGPSRVGARFAPRDARGLTLSPLPLASSLLGATAPLTSSSIWSVAPSPNRAPRELNNDLLQGISAVSPTDIWAVGSFCCPGEAGLKDRSLIEHWDGAAWSIVPDPRAEAAGSQLRGVAAVSANDVWAAGYTTPVTTGDMPLIEHWDGAAWSVIPIPNPGQRFGADLYAIVALSAGNVWAVGEYDTGRRFGPLIEHWDGTRWSVVPGPTGFGGVDRLTAISAVNPNDIWATGDVANPNSEPTAEHWDGTRWSVAPVVTGFLDSRFSSVTAVSSSDVWAVGYEVPNVKHEHHYTLVEHWDGARWSRIPSPNIGQYDNWLQGVTALSSTDVWAVGYDFGTAGNGLFSLFEHWDGAAWRLAAGPPALERSGNDLYAVTAAGPGLLRAVGERSALGPGQRCERTLTVQTTHG